MMYALDPNRPVAVLPVELALRATAVVARAPQDIPAAKFDCRFCYREDVPVLQLDCNGACATCSNARRYR